MREKGRGISGKLIVEGLAYGLAEGRSLRSSGARKLQGSNNVEDLLLITCNKKRIIYNS
jgi:hypothetical protein